MSHVDSEQTDIIWGAEGIAKLIGRSRRQTFHMLNCGELPARKIGDRWVASRAKLIAHLTGEAA